MPGTYRSNNSWLLTLTLCNAACSTCSSSLHTATADAVLPHVTAGPAECTAFQFSWLAASGLAQRPSGLGRPPAGAGAAGASRRQLCCAQQGDQSCQTCISAVNRGSILCFAMALPSCSLPLAAQRCTRHGRKPLLPQGGVVPPSGARGGSHAGEPAGAAVCLAAGRHLAGTSACTAWLYCCLMSHCACCPGLHFLLLLAVPAALSCAVPCTHLLSRWAARLCLQAFLYVSPASRLVGCVIAEPLSHAYAVVVPVTASVLPQQQREAAARRQGEGAPQPQPQSSTGGAACSPQLPGATQTAGRQGQPVCPAADSAEQSPWPSAAMAPCSSGRGTDITENYDWALPAHPGISGKALPGVHAPGGGMQAAGGPSLQAHLPQDSNQPENCRYQAVSSARALPGKQHSDPAATGSIPREGQAVYPQSSPLAVAVDTSRRMPASCGIRAVWTSVESRRQGIATKLLDACRSGALLLELCMCISCLLKGPSSCHPCILQVPAAVFQTVQPCISCLSAPCSCCPGCRQSLCSRGCAKRLAQSPPTTSDGAAPDTNVSEWCPCSWSRQQSASS